MIVAALVFGTGLAIRVVRMRNPGMRWSQILRPAPLLPGGFHFTDATRELGIRFIYRDPVLSPLFEGKERLFFWGAGAAVADVNGDGFMDLFFVASHASEKNHLYLNRAGRGFDEAAADWGVADNDPDSVHVSAAFLDYDNDGRPDLFLSGLRCTQLMRNTGARFEDVTRAAGLRDCDNSIATLPVDTDGDGRLDLYLLRYWSSIDLTHPTTSRIWPENHFNALNGGRNALFHNRGDGTFEPVTGPHDGGDTHWTLDATFGDLAGTGKQELYLANDFGADVVYSISDGGLVDQPGRLGMPDRRFGMGVSLGDLSRDGAPHVFVTNEYVDGYVQTGNFLWRFNAGGAARDEGRDRDVDACGWAWGSVFGDFDLDGRQDLYVANGFITGEEGKKDLINQYYAALRRDYAFTAGTIMASPGAVAMEVKHWPKPGTFSYAGHQNDCLFWNRGDRFVDVAERAGLVEEADGRAIMTVDFDNNGSLDLLLTTQNGPPHLYRNEIDPGDHWIGFTLQGSRSNRDGAGARVELRQGNERWYRWATAGRTGFLAGSDPRIHFGVPSGGAVDVRVRWPSGPGRPGGEEQEWKELQPGRYHTLVERP